MPKEQGNYYLIGIDETGNFDDSNYEEKSHIGGIVLKDYSRQNIRESMEDICIQHQQPELAQSLNHLHYYDAKAGKITLYGNSNIRISQEESMSIICDIISNVKEHSEMFFISTGFPKFVAEEQHAYIELLRTTLWGLLKDTLKLQFNDHVVVSIAERSVAKGKYGKWEFQSNEYHKYIAKQLEEEFAIIKKDKELECLKFEFAKPQDKNHEELIIADLVIGNYRIHKNKGILKQYYVDRKYAAINYHDYLHHLIGKSEVENLVAGCKEGKYPIIPSIFQLFYLYAIEESFLENIEKSIKELFQQITMKEYLQQSFLKTLESEFLSLMVNRVHDKKSLAIATKFCELCDSLISIGDSKFLLCIQEIVYRYRITISSHKGNVDINNVIESYRKFFANARESLYPTMAERVKSFLDTELQSVQVAYFNTYNFKEVEKIYSDYEKGYRKMCIGYQTESSSIFAKVCGCKDSLFGKVCGTLGQAYSFLYAIYRQDENYTLGKSLLKDDTDNFIYGTDLWSQGMDYRIHLELCKGDIQTAFDLLKEEFNCSNSNLTPESLINHLLIRSKDTTPCSVWNISIAVKFLGYYKHFHPDFQISQENWHSLLEMIQEDWYIYPKCNILKWLAYLAINTENKEKTSITKDSQNNAKLALEKINHGLLKSNGFTIETLQIPILLLESWIKSESPKKYLEVLQQLMNQQQYFKECMEQYCWEQKFPNKSTKSWELWDIMTMLPFYYA